LFSRSFIHTVIHFLFVPLWIRCMPLNNGYFSTKVKGLENSVIKHFFDIGTWFCMVLNMYNKNKKVAGVCLNICFFSVSPTRNSTLRYHPSAAIYIKSIVYNFIAQTAKIRKSRLFVTKVVLICTARLSLERSECGKHGAKTDYFSHR
ncbi:hypothetical protein TSAR_000233, partial [Trichomalopsis sarcophagae]